MDPGWKKTKISFWYYVGWGITLFLIFLFSMVMITWGIDGGIFFKICLFPMAFLFLLLELIVVFVMIALLFNGRVKYSDDHFMVKDIHKKPFNPFSSKYRKILYTDIKSYEHTSGYKEKRIKLVLKNGKKYNIGGLIFLREEWDEFVEIFKLNCEVPETEEKDQKASTIIPPM